ncbi:MAG: hypothetical protein K5888_11345 [Lachnospiraceae bacterium]|nr:hypothetical protein [Lachnospiraceae bacterium]
MKKDLETEYRQQIADEVPDLWARIEASIDEIEGTGSNAAPEETTVPKAGAEEKEDNIVPITKAAEKKQGSGSRIKKINGILRYSAVIAGAACVLLVIFAVSRSGNKMSAATAPMAAMSESAAADTATGDTAEKTRKKKGSKGFMGEAAAEAAAEAPNEAYTDSAAFDSAPMEEAVAEAEEYYDETDSMEELDFAAEENDLKDNAVYAADVTGTSDSSAKLSGSSASGSNRDAGSETENMTVKGKITDSETVENKAKNIYYITITDEDGNEYSVFVPEEKEEEVRALEEEGKELKFTLSISTGGYYDAEYVYEGAE